MDLKTRKYNFIQELISIERTSVLDALERVLKNEKEKEDQISPEQKQELDVRLKSYKDNPHDVLDWENVKNEW
ncbi:addiction module protein [Aequorivita capsosiphonis]|uniref:addiction module protein n=1 Tax=Aequorivita capsosiphonis TaxID=487317 RepID=UPI00047EAB7F|nr:addiction module protein [Aequorivita capsosiphonis]